MNPPLPYKPCELTIKATALGIPRAYFTANISIENALKVTTLSDNLEKFKDTLKLLCIDVTSKVITGKQLISILDYLIRTESIFYSKNNVKNEYFLFPKQPQSPTKKRSKSIF